MTRLEGGGPDGGVGDRRSDRCCCGVRGSSLAREDARTGQDTRSGGGQDRWIGAGHGCGHGRQGGRRGSVARRSRRAGRDGHGRVGSVRGFQDRDGTPGRQGRTEASHEDPGVRWRPGRTIQDPSWAGPVDRCRSHSRVDPEDRPTAQDPSLLRLVSLPFGEEQSPRGRGAGRGAADAPADRAEGPAAEEVRQARRLHDTRQEGGGAEADGEHDRISPTHE